jgi:hypothetical protein
VPLVMKRVERVGIESVSKEGVDEGVGSRGNNNNAAVGVDGDYRCSCKGPERTRARACWPLSVEWRQGGGARCRTGPRGPPCWWSRRGQQVSDSSSGAR